ncbi:MAG TPA: pantetheine-phosphate adenylyltransferase [bacterium]|nr:pantetheine-phosphate adenylyltransferase [bacterium]HEX67868.1 pantetheine-phosphate adenylyltransferase [bacterium]
MKVIYPGTFDPITYGHLDLIERACRIFSYVLVGVAVNPQKRPLFSIEERVEMVKEVTRGFPKVEVEAFNGLLVDFARKKGIKIILRGVRAISDFEYEFQMALSNRKLAPEIETVFMMPKENYSFLSSKIIKEAASLGADLKEFVPPLVEKRLKEKLWKR